MPQSLVLLQSVCSTGKERYGSGSASAASKYWRLKGKRIVSCRASLLDQQNLAAGAFADTVAKAADAATRLSAVAEHTLQHLIASTSASSLPTLGWVKAEGLTTAQATASQAVQAPLVPEPLPARTFRPQLVQELASTSPQEDTEVAATALQQSTDASDDFQLVFEFDLEPEEMLEAAKLPDYDAVASAASELRASEAGPGWYHVPDVELAGDGWYHIPEADLAALQATSEQAVQASPPPELEQEVLTRGLEQQSAQDPASALPVPPTGADAVSGLQQGIDASRSQIDSLSGAQAHQLQLPDYGAVVSAAKEFRASDTHLQQNADAVKSQLQSPPVAAELPDYEAVLSAANKLRSSDAQVQPGTDALTSQIASPSGAEISKLPDYGAVTSAARQHKVWETPPGWIKVPEEELRALQGASGQASHALPPEPVRDALQAAAAQSLQSPPQLESAQDLLTRGAEQQSLQEAAGTAPHYGTKAAADALQQGIDAFNSRFQGQPASNAIKLPDLAAVADAANGLKAQAAGFLSRAGMAVTAPVAQVSNSLASQGPGPISQEQVAEPHYGTDAALKAADAASRLVKGLVTQQAGSNPSASWDVQSGIHSLSQSLQKLQPGAGIGEQLTRSLVSLQAALNAVVAQATPSAPAWPHFDTPAFQTTLSGNAISWQSAEFGGHSFLTIAVVSAAVTAAIIATTPSANARSAQDLDDSLPGEYNAQSVAAYWDRRPVAVARRSVTVAFAAAAVGLGLLIDRGRGTLQTNSAGRATQLRKAIEKLGPAYVKVAQAVSTRVDLLDMNYLLEIERLQDRVPPFPTPAALLVMTKAFGRPVDEVFYNLSAEPVASASLGQVYQGQLRGEYGGGEVAVKVQRPAVQESVALDLLLMRRFAAYAQTFPQVRTNWVGLIDEWATRFFHELDYEREAENGMTFKQQMVGLEGIVVADVYQQLTNKQVLTTAWVQGEKLSESNASDVRELCTTLLNCYLIQLLETGFLHADPHPGNLIRTPDGRICILDFGLMTEVTPEQSLALVEYIAHLSVQDWNGIALDLRKLGFIPADAPEMSELGLIGPLGNILSQLTQGGGAKGINIDAVTVALEELSKDYPIDIPPYFALILRAFSVIEGTALRVDPDYAIVKETFPYLSRRLLTDNHPRARAALRQLLYGDKARLDIERLQRVSAGFGSFTTSGIQAPQQTPEAGPILDPNSREVLKLIFSQNGNYLQEVLVDELVAGVDAIGREASSNIMRLLLGTPPALATFTTLQALGPFRFILAPFPTFFEILDSLQPAISPKAEDEEALSTVRGIWSILQPSLNQQLDNQRRQQLWNELTSLLPEILPGLGLTAEMFARQLLARVAIRFAEEMRRPPQRYTQQSMLSR